MNPRAPGQFAQLLRRNGLSSAAPKRNFHTSAINMSEKLKPAARVAGQRQDVW